MNTNCMAMPAFLHRPARCSTARARRWVLAAGLLSGAGAAAHPYGPFGLPIFLPPPPPPGFLRPAPALVPAVPAQVPLPARPVQKPQAPPPPFRQPVRMTDHDLARCPVQGTAGQDCPGKPHGDHRIASEFRTAGMGP